MQPGVVKIYIYRQVSEKEKKKGGNIPTLDTDNKTQNFHVPLLKIQVHSKEKL